MNDLEVGLDDVRRQHSVLAKLSLNDMAKLKQALSNSGATWAQAAQRVNIAVTAILTQTKLVYWEKTKITQHEGVSLFQFAVDFDVNVVMRAESAMIDALANETFNPADTAIYFSCGTN